MPAQTPPAIRRDRTRDDASAPTSGPPAREDAAPPVRADRPPGPSAGITIYCRTRYYALLGIYPECVVRDAASERSVRLAWGEATYVALAPDRVVTVEVYVRTSLGALGAEGGAATECRVDAGEVRRYEYRAPWVTGGAGALMLAERR